MYDIVLKMLVGEAAKCSGLTSGIGFASLLNMQQSGDQTADRKMMP
jgi:hypothetical protein